MSLGEVVSLAESYQYDLIVITGGEPFRQSRVIELSALLINRKKTVQFETNGTISDGGVPIFSFLRPYIICSPKTPKVSRHLLPYITHWKYLVRAGEVDPDDGLPSCISINFSDQKPARPQDCSKYDIFLCPLDEGDPEKNKANLEAAALSCLKFGYRLSTQIHKMIPHLLP
jgi:organic radical activating enzyme